MLTEALSYVIAAALRGLFLGAAALIGLSLMRGVSTGVRLLVWRAVLYAALAMPVLTGLLPHVEWSWPAAPAAAAAWPPSGGPTGFVPSGGPRPEPAWQPQLARPSQAQSGAIDTSTRSPMGPAAPRPLFSLPAAVASIYAAGLLVFLMRALVGWRLARRLERAAAAIDDPVLQERVRLGAIASRLVNLPRLTESDAITVPVTLSAFDPTLVLPVGWRAWTAATLDAVLAHELAHIARRDAATQRLAIAYQTIFWFSPLGWWLPGHLAELAEHASDESALAAGSNPAEYAQTLLDFLATLHGRPRRAEWTAIAMARRAGAQRRIERILAWQPARPRRVTRLALCTVVLASASFATLTASVRILPATAPAIPEVQSPSLAIAPITPPEATPAAPIVSIESAIAPPLALAATQARASGASRNTEPCDLCTLIDDPRLVWLKAYAGRTTYDVTQDGHFHDLMTSIVPGASFHFRIDMPLGDALSTILTASGLPVELRNDRYIWVSSCATANCQSGRGLAFLWVDALEGVGIGGIYFAPSNGEPTPTLTLFSKGQRGPLTSSTQLPPAFLADLTRWAASRDLPVAARYFINASGAKSVVLHDERCALSAAASPCDAADVQAAEKDVDAALFLAMSHDAAGTPAQLALRVSQNAWNMSRAKMCGGTSSDADLACRVQSARDRARELQSPAAPR